MKIILNVITFAAFFAALGIVGAVERGGDLNRLLWLLPCLIVMGIAAAVQDAEQYKKFLREEVLKAGKR